MVYSSTMPDITDTSVQKPNVLFGNICEAED